MGHVHFKLVARQQLGVAVGSLAAGEPPREKLFILAMEATVPREGKRREERGERKKKRRRRKKRGRREEKRGEEEEERKEGGGVRREEGRKGGEGEGGGEEKVKHWLQISTHVMLYFLLTTVQSCVKDLTQSRTRRSSERLVRREREGGRKSHIANHSTKSNFTHNLMDKPIGYGCTPHRHGGPSPGRSWHGNLQGSMLPWEAGDRDVIIGEEEKVTLGVTV